MLNVKTKDGMILRPINSHDLETRVAWMNHPLVYSNMHFDVPITLDNTIQWYNRIKNSPNRCDVVFLDNGVENSIDNIIAFGGLTSINTELSMAELYVFVSPFLQHLGIGTKATMLLCEYGFIHLNLNKIYLITNEENKSAQRVYEKCGFVLEGRMREEYIGKNGQKKDRLYFGLLKSDWK